MTTNRPRGRRPGSSDTRSEILAAALKLFSEIGYEKVSLRAIARAAEVDPALVHHYFDSKPELFSEAVLDLPIDEPRDLVATILDGPADGIGERAMTVVLSTLDLPNARERFTAMLRAAVSDPGAQRPLSEFFAKEFYTKVAAAQGHANAKQRGELAVTTVLGLIMGRDLLRLPHLVKMSRKQLITVGGRSLQTYLVDPW